MFSSTLISSIKALLCLNNYIGGNDPQFDGKIFS